MFPIQTTTDNMILSIMAITVILIFGGAIYAFVIAIFQLVFSKGEPEKVKKAWNNIRYMILGIILVVILLFIGPIMIKKLEIPGYEKYSARSIFQKASDMVKMLFNAKNSMNNQNKYQAPSTQSGEL